MSAITPIAPVSSIQGVSVMQEVQQVDSLSLEDRMLQAFAERAAGAENLTASIHTRLQDPYAISNPETLASIQMAKSQHEVEISFISAVTSKMVKVFETL